MDTIGDDGGTVVVGFDGSRHAEAAVRWAIAEGGRRGAAVRVVVAHEPPDAWMTTYGYPLIADSGELRAAVEETARERVEEVRAALGDADRAVPVTVVAITGPAAHVLTQEAQGAAVLVVGHRGRGGLRSALLGSVGLSAVLHAPCPVTVVPAAPVPHEEATEDDLAFLAGPLPAGPLA
ncbi:universal stress protein [Actinomycetospora straminea]|nr:universal stress protein [Actinomycetospora straminea]MDD7933213.1 universal stress protein [Actinomycetospora straminea]